MKLNNVVETNLHVIPKTKNEIPTKPIDVSQLRHVIHLQLADPTFNVRGKIDLLLGAEYSSPILANTSLIAPSSCTEDLISKFWELESVLDKSIFQMKRRDVKFNSIKPQSVEMMVDSLLNCLLIKT